MKIATQESKKLIKAALINSLKALAVTLLEMNVVEHLGSTTTM
jgi:hypothetical protein